MGWKNTNDFITLEDVKEKYHQVKQVFKDISDVSVVLNNLKEPLLFFRLVMPKNENQFITYPHAESKINRSAENDRVFPLETVSLQRFRTNHESDIERAIIHTGPYANELTRTFSVLALTIGEDIFFRDNSYNPGSEEGRKTITHELTHVSQYQNGELTQNRTRKGLEEEADEAEAQEICDKDSIISIKLRGKRYQMPKSKMRYYVQRAANTIEEWMREQETILDEKEYLSLLCAYDEWLGC
jgi:hypothetical protein